MTATDELIDARDFSSLLLGNTAFIDVRAEIEHEAGSLPGAVNIPLLTTGERTLVGTCYQEHGQGAAIRLGEELVCGSIKETRVDGWEEIVHGRPAGDAVVYCARGGLRSEIAQRWLAQRNVFVPRVRGGYKALRFDLLEKLRSLPRSMNFIVVSGYTGSGKTRIIEALSMSGRSTINLEALAHHRGSAFGGFTTPQPAQATFENHLAAKLILLSTRDDASCVVEDESLSIGKLRLPEALYERMRSAPLVVVDMPIAERVELLRNDYVLSLYDELFRRGAGEEDVYSALERILLEKMCSLRKRLGGARIEELCSFVREAMRDQRDSGSAEAHARWIEPLLSEYYDPFYEKHLARERERIAHRGSWEEVKSLLGAFRERVDLAAR